MIAGEEWQDITTGNFRCSLIGMVTGKCARGVPAHFFARDSVALSG